MGQLYRLSQIANSITNTCTRNDGADEEASSVCSWCCCMRSLLFAFFALTYHLQDALLTNGLILERLQRDEGFRKFVAGETSIACVDGTWAENDIAAIRQDAQALRAVGFGAVAGVASKTTGIRNGVHQIWLQSPAERQGSGSSSLPTTLFVGDLDARKRLLRSIDALRESIQQPNVRSDDRLATRHLPPHLVELSYLLYEGGGASYAKHIDCTNTTAQHEQSGGTQMDSRRCVSLLLYLGGDGYSRVDEEWDADRHGGALRIHGLQHGRSVSARSSSTPQTTADDAGSVQGRSWVDLAPLPGRMVLFDSSAVWHEVLPTVTQRFAVVGWFRTPC